MSKKQFRDEDYPTPWTLFEVGRDKEYKGGLRLLPTPDPVEKSLFLHVSSGGP